MNTDKLKPGARVEVQRIGAEKRQGYILAGPLEYLRHIGPFYLIGDHPPVLKKKGSRKEAAGKDALKAFGMYDARDIVLPGNANGKGTMNHER